jgi:hypothetical protein
VNNKHFGTQLHLEVETELLMYNTQIRVVTRLLKDNNKNKTEASQNTAKMVLMGTQHRCLNEKQALAYTVQHAK